MYINKCRQFSVHFFENGHYEIYLLKLIDIEKDVFWKLFMFVYLPKLVTLLYFHSIGIK